MAKKRKTVLCVLLVILVFCLAGCSSKPISTSVTKVECPDNVAPFEVNMLDVGQGLCILIKADDKYMIYDGGGRESSSYVVSYLKQHDIDKLDYMFVSHFDEDHISGLIGVLHTSDVDRIITPDYESDSQIYSSLKNAISLSSFTEEHPEVGDEFKLGDATITVLGPDNYESGNENNRSIAVRVEYGGFSCVLTGDAEVEEEVGIISSNKRIESDLYIVGHHGSGSSSSEELLEAISPDYAFISVGRDNKYGHPDDYTLDRLERIGAEIYRTDELGEVTAYTDGSVLWFNSQEKQIDQEESVIDSEDAQYVLNTSSYKFHKSTCGCIKDMSEYNKAYSSKTRKELIDEGYEPCKVCNP